MRVGLSANCPVTIMLSILFKLRSMQFQVCSSNSNHNMFFSMQETRYFLSSFSQPSCVEIRANAKLTYCACLSNMSKFFWTCHRSVMICWRGGLCRGRSRSRDKRSRSSTPERKAPVNAEGAITVRDEPLDKVLLRLMTHAVENQCRFSTPCTFGLRWCGLCVGWKM